MEDVVGWFELTYSLDVGLGWARWRLTTLPYAGALADQPAKLMTALAFVAQLRNVQLIPKRRTRTREKRQRERRG